jgi:hypothetical protein
MEAVGGGEMIALHVVNGLCECEGQLQPEGSPLPPPQAFFCLCISWMGAACLRSPSRILAAGP